MSAVEKLIDVCHNSQDVRSLCLRIAHDWNTEFILISWYITENTWYIPMIFDKNIRGIEKNKSLGWYINEEPNTDNIPIQHSELINPVVYKYDKLIIIIDSIETIDRVYLFVMESFINSLAYTNHKKRNKYQHELLLNNISHSIRTPLNGILHMTNMLLSNDKLTSGSINQQTRELGSSNTPSLTSKDNINKEHLQYLNQSVVSLANNIFDIVDMSQLSLGKLKINKEIFNVRELVNQVIAISTTMSKNNSINVEYYVENIVPDYVYCDAKRIKQILINLMENAFRNTDSGEVTLYVTASLIYLDHEDCDYGIVKYYKKNINHYNITFKVSDTGSGIDDKTVDMLFKSTKVLINKKHHGIGFGLRVSYLLANKIGGDLRLKSTSSTGSIFELNIIVYEEEPPKFDSATLKALSNKKVLLIDDSNDKVNICKVMDACCIIYNTASSYEEVLILHIHKMYDLIICQTHLKEEDGVTIAERLSKIWENAIFLAISSNAEMLPTGIFNDSISLPIEEYTIKNKLITMFSTNYNTDDISILAVEDEQINRIIIEKLLRAKGYTDIGMASNGKEALKILKSNKYTIVLVDIRMPIMSGFEFARHMHTLFGKNRPRLIGITAQMIMEDDPKELFDDFVYKPVDIDELDKKIKNIKNIKNFNHLTHVVE